MKKLLLLIIILLSSTLSFGQRKEIFRDDFNYNVWKVGVSKYGKLHLKQDVTQKLTWGLKPVNINSDADFVIEASVSLNNQSDGGAYLIFGAERQSHNFHYINIEKSDIGYNVNIGKKTDGQWTSVQEKTEGKTRGQESILTIKKNDNIISFYVDNKFIYSKDFEPFFGNEIGVGCGGIQEVSFDYIVVKQDERNTTSYLNNGDQSALKTEINLKKIGGVYEVPVELNGVLKIDFIFDSGASDVSISPDVALTLIKTGTIKEEDWLPGAYYKFADGSTAKSMRFRLKSVKVGGKIVYDVTCSISNSFDAPMLLGQSVLSKFGRYTFDYKKEKLIIE